MSGEERKSMGTTNFDVIQANAVIGGSSLMTFGNTLFVDGDNGSDGNSGEELSSAKATVQGAVNAASAGDVIWVKARDMAATDTDPISYAETIIIPAGKSRLTIAGIASNRTQGGLPQIRKGSGSTALLTVRAPGCRILGLSFNGASATGGGILLDDDGGTVKTAFGTEIAYCHFKNCKGSTATDSRTGGAIQWASTGGAWQVWIHDNRSEAQPRALTATSISLAALV